MEDTFDTCRLTHRYTLTHRQTDSRRLQLTFVKFHIFGSCIAGLQKLNPYKSTKHTQSFGQTNTHTHRHIDTYTGIPKHCNSNKHAWGLNMKWNFAKTKYFVIAFNIGNMKYKQT